MSGSELTKEPSYQVPERPRVSLTNHRNLAYNILKYLENEMVKDKEILDLGPCFECTNDILILSLKAFTVLSCRHLFYRLCIEKKLMVTRPDVCPFPDCRKKIDIIYLVSTRRGSQSSQSSGTLDLSNWMGEKFNLISPIPEDPMEKVEDTSIQETEKHLFCTKYSEKITPDFPKDTVFLSCKHAIHYDCIDNPRKKCSTCLVEDLGLFPVESTTQRRRSNESSADNTSRKKVKSSGRDNSQILKRLIQELSTDISEDDIILELDPSSASSTNAPIDFLKLYKDILDAEDASKKTAQDLIFRYFHFGKALKDRYNFFQKTNPKRTSQGLVNNEVRKQIPVSVSESLLRKTKERAQKIYDMFSELGIDKIKQIKTFTISTLTHISQEDIDYILAMLLSL
ncbi:hypothetical protein RclHR1_09920010 [Rhizophagus clarus]|uniref:RING-type domain-containing protein n=1 Tax=Rhizophagus clarus TaxID=94130 RepID=A0A2Z6SJG9_9GLOM|nr:hypothetical protein RclHR1_09920010 [Rhizophagus clarus]GES87786.1 hypothetical protein GLOIN_2v1769762 [Rhizophagus clarus]